MTKEEAKKHIQNLSNYKSTSLEISAEYNELFRLAHEAKKVLGYHRFQQPYEVLIKEFPTMTREYYDNKRKSENIN